MNRIFLKSLAVLTMIYRVQGAIQDNVVVFYMKCNHNKPRMDGTEAFKEITCVALSK